MYVENFAKNLSQQFKDVEDPKGNHTASYYIKKKVSKMVQLMEYLLEDVLVNISSVSILFKFTLYHDSLSNPWIIG